MNDVSEEKGCSSDLRNRALEILHQRPQDFATLSDADFEHLVHELSVYQIELEMQNQELREAQAETERSRQEYADFYNFTPVGYLSLSVKGIIEKVNLTASVMLQEERTKLLKYPFSKFILSEDLNAYYSQIQSMLETKEQQECELRIKRKDGSIFWICMLSRTVMNQDGEVTQIRSVITDITEHKKAESERERLIKVLDLKNRELQDIVYTASHDLRSPLVNIDGFSSILKSYCDDIAGLFAEQAGGADKSEEIKFLINEEIPESLKFITCGIKKMASLIDGLLQVSRVGSVKMNIESLDAGNNVMEVIRTLDYQIKENNITVTVGTLPNCMGDSDMLDHVFTNLISNAIKYRDPARECEIRISGRIEDGTSVYCVEDNGIGIAADHQKKVFEIFHRLDPNGSAGGEGLGLTIVTRLMDRMNGNIWVESEPGRGSKFFIALPTSID